MQEPPSAHLLPGAAHYRAYVGPPADYDILGALQFNLLTMLGLRQQHTLLDYGCGSLRAGRLLIPYLDAGKYFGLEPNQQLIEDALAFQVGRDIVHVKRPSFLHHDTFGTQEFGTTFDFVLAQSILSHTGADLALTVLRAIGDALSQTGVAAVTYQRSRWPRSAPAESGWKYPACVRFRSTDFFSFASEAGLYAAPLRWWHPRQRWVVLARERDALPPLRARLQSGYRVRR